MGMVELRAAVEQVDREIAALPLPSSVLRGAWSQLVCELVLGPALCGYCWKKLVPADGAERGELSVT